MQEKYERTYWMEPIDWRVTYSNILPDEAVIPNRAIRTIYVGNIYRFIFQNFGVTNKNVQFCCDHALEKINKMIDDRCRRTIRHSIFDDYDFL